MSAEAMQTDDNGADRLSPEAQDILQEGAVLWVLPELLDDWGAARLRAALEPDEKIALCFASDMEIDGRYVPELLAVSDRRIFVVRPDERGLLREISLGDVAMVAVRKSMGNGILQLTTLHGHVRMLRFSASLASEAAELSDELEEHLQTTVPGGPLQQNGTDDESEDDEPVAAQANRDARARCPQCGQLLPPRMEICTACLDKRTVMRRLLGYLAPFKALVAVTVGMTAFIALLQVAIPRIARDIINKAVMPQDRRMLAILVGIVAVLFFLQAGLSAVRRVLNARLAQDVIYDLREAVYSHLQRLSMSYHDRQSTGRLISRVVSDTSRLQRFAVGGLQRLLVNALVMIIILVWMLCYSIPLTLLLWIPVPIYFFLIKWYRGNVHKIFRKAFRKRAAMSGHLSDTIPGIDMVKAFSQEDAAISRFNYYSDGFRNELIRANRFSAIFTAAFMTLTQVGTILVYWFGGSKAIAGAGFGMGELVMFVGWVGMINAPVRRVAHLTEQYENAITSAERVFDVLDTEVTISRNEEGPEVEQIGDHIRFDHVSFAYDDGPTVLKNVSFSVRPGETVGIVGPSGAGKSTLIKLLCRYYDVSSGAILVDGTPLSDLRLADYRRQISVVGQEPFLFRDTILENIRYGKPHADRDEVIRSARVANAHDFIMRFPEGYDTDARERGSRFSGGEKQRLCIARAVLKNPNILILDEATSSVDTKNEKLIQNALDRLVKDRTAFIIAHRLSTLRNADRILMLQDGEVLDIAPHDELMDRCLPYRELVEAQKEFGEQEEAVVA